MAQSGPNRQRQIYLSENSETNFFLGRPVHTKSKTTAENTKIAQIVRERKNIVCNFTANILLFETAICFQVWLTTKMTNKYVN